MAGVSVCRSGCPTQDHSSWGACARAGVRFAPFWSGAVQKERAWDAELAEYRQARAQGIQPATTKTRDIRAAVELSRAADRPFDAGSGSFAD